MIGKQWLISEKAFLQQKLHPISNLSNSMVKKWKKQIDKINSSGKMDIEKIVDDIIDGHFFDYDIKPLE